MNNPEILTRKEAIITAGNVLITLRPDHAMQLIEQYQDLLTSYLNGLQLISSEDVILSILDVIEHFAKTDREAGNQNSQKSFMAQIEIHKGYDHLEELQKIPNQRIYSKVIDLMQNWIECEDDPIANGHEQMKTESTNQKFQI